jgi:hypothetical protein
MTGRRKWRRSFWIKTTLASASGVLALCTLISREWIEVVLHVDPDAGSGLLEWASVVALAAATLLFTVNARAESRKATTGPLPRNHSAAAERLTLPLGREDDGGAITAASGPG